MWAQALVYGPLSSTERRSRLSGDTETEGVRFELRELVDSYALGVDRKQVREVAALFTAEGRLVTTFGPGTPETPVVRTGTDDITAALTEGLARYLCTTHIVGAHRAVVTADSVTGETSCLAHHVYERAGERRLLVMAVRYEDCFALQSGRWRFAERRLSVDWRTDTPLG